MVFRDPVEQPSSSIGDEATVDPATAGRSANWYSPTHPTLTWRMALGSIFEREAELGRAVLWLPALFGIGILAYFGLPHEPAQAALLLIAAFMIAAVVATRRGSAVFRVFVVLAAVCAGLATAKIRTDIVTAPILAGEVTGELSGWVEAIERFSPNVRRLVVKVVSLEGVAEEDTPDKVRITVRGSFDAVEIGAGISGLVALQPPPAPVMPGGYDFGRQLFFRGIGGSGFSYGPPDIVDLGPAPFGIRASIPINAFRSAVGARIEAALSGETGEIANALITGDRGGISDQATEALRRSGLGHILAISGLHMALVAGAVFGFMRALLALSPTLALRKPIKKWAASAALGVAAFYLVLSGASIATQRSFIMLSVMLVAVLLDRRAFSVRNVAVAATIILVLTPEAILTASFQMSFAATLALIAGFEIVSEKRRQRLAVGPPAERRIARTVLLWGGGLLLTSILAGLATAPFAAFHFHRTAPLSLVANFVAMPFVSLIVMPSALLSVVLMPLGLEFLPLKAMDFGLRQVLDIAETVADWTGNAGLVPASPVSALLAVAIGLVWLCLWRQRWRLFGIPMIAAGVAVAALAPRPDVLVADTGSAIAVRSADGHYRIVGGGASFEVETWLRADADPRALQDPSLSEGINCDPLGCTAVIGDSGLRVALATEPIALLEDCRRAAVVVTAFIGPEDCPALLIDRDQLTRYGAHAIYVEPNAEREPILRVTTARPANRRPWMAPLPPDQ